MLDMYQAYVAEREGKEFFNYEDKGFAVYSIEEYKGERILYVSTIYVRPEHRRGHLTFKMTDKICELVKEADPSIKSVFGSACVETNNFEYSLMGFIKYGMRKSHMSGSVIYYKKEI